MKNETMPVGPGGSDKRGKISNAEWSAWEKRLADEGMSAEITPESEPSSEAFAEALHEARIHYIYAEDATHTVHHQSMQEILSRAKAMGASAEELERIDEDFMRQVEDEVSSAQTAAVEIYNKVATRDETRQMMRMNNSVVIRQMRDELKKAFPHFERDVIDALAKKVVDDFESRRDQPYQK
jgi:hypothetical protein